MSLMLSAKLWNKDTLAEVSSWYESTKVREPLVLTDALDEQDYKDLRDALSALTCWRRTYCLSSGGTEFEIVNKTTFFNTQPAQRWGAQSLISPKPSLILRPDLNTPERLALGKLLLNIVFGKELSRWIDEAIGGGEVEVGTCEFASYERDDFLVPHSDTHDSRFLAVNIYLDVASEATGGRLGYIEQELSTVLDLPANSLSLIQIGPARRHWVEPWQETHRGRYTVSLSIRPILDSS